MQFKRLNISINILQNASFADKILLNVTSVHRRLSVCINICLWIATMKLSNTNNNIVLLCLSSLLYSLICKQNIHIIVLFLPPLHYYANSLYFRLIIVHRTSVRLIYCIQICQFYAYFLLECWRKNEGQWVGRSLTLTRHLANQCRYGIFW